MAHVKREKHKMSRSPEYRIWAGMKNRCLNKSNTKYSYYGGRGITFDKEWNKFSSFLRDVGVRPSKKHELDRIDNNKGYSKENCRWVDRKTQNRNRNPLRKSKTGISGVTIEKGGYRVRITADYKRIYLGFVYSLEEAVELRKKAELKFWKSTCM